jgi:hypothetical protein
MGANEVFKIGSVQHQPQGINTEKADASYTRGSKGFADALREQALKKLKRTPLFDAIATQYMPQFQGNCVFPDGQAAKTEGMAAGKSNAIGN